MKYSPDRARFGRQFGLCAALVLAAVPAHAAEKPVPVLTVPAGSGKAAHIKAIEAIDAFKAGTRVYAIDRLNQKMPGREMLLRRQTQQQLDGLFEQNEMIHNISR